MQQVYLGIDVGNTFSTFVAVNEDQEPMYYERIRTFDEREWLELLGLFEGCEIYAAFEIGTHYGWMYDLLSKHCVRVDVVNAQAFAIISKSTKKTDKIDAEKLALGAWRGDLPTVTVPEERVRQDRRLVSQMHHLSKASTRVKNQIRSILLRARLVCPQRCLAGRKAMRWLKDEAMQKLDAQEQVFLQLLLSQLRLLTYQYQKLAALAPDRVEAYAMDAELARSIPGFGQLVTLALLSAIAGVGRFRTPDELASYFGLCGEVSQSGDSLYLGHATRRGSSSARWLLGQAITHLIRKDPKAKKRYDKLRRKKKAKVARLAMMRWLVTVLWRMLTNKEKYRLNGKKGQYLKRKAA